MIMSLICLTSCFTDDDDLSEAVEGVEVGDALPDFTVTLSDGAQVSPSTLSGKVSVIVFFNTTCKDCQRELPLVQRVYEDEGDEVNFVCISREQSAVDVAAYWGAQSLTLPYSAQTDRSVYNLFASATIPRVYVTDADGIVRSVFVEAMGEESLRQAIVAAQTIL